jgi:hypothetical protein
MGDGMDYPADVMRITMSKASRQPLLLITTVVYIWASSALPFASQVGSLRWLFVTILAIQALNYSFLSHTEMRVSVPALYLMIFCTYSIAVAPLSGTPLATTIRSATFSIVIVATVFRNMWHRSDGLGRWILGLATLNSIACVALWIQIITGIGHPYVGVGLAGFTGNPNQLGGYLVLSIGAMVMFTRSRQRGRRRPYLRWLGIFTIISDIIFVILTQSRTSLIALVAALLIFTLTMQGSRKVRTISLSILIAVGSLVIASGPIIGAVGSLISKGSPSALLASRSQSLSVTWALVVKNPLIGSGFGTLSTATQGTVSQSATDIFSHSPGGIEQSNSLMGIAADLGIVGLLLMSCILIGIVLSMKRMGVATGWKRLPAEEIALFTIVVVSLVHMNGEAWLVAPGAFQALIFWTAVGYVLRRATNRGGIIRKNRSLAING